MSATVTSDLVEFARVGKNRAKAEHEGLRVVVMGFWPVHIRQYSFGNWYVLVGDEFGVVPEGETKTKSDTPTFDLTGENDSALHKESHPQADTAIVQLHGQPDHMRAKRHR